MPDRIQSYKVICGGGLNSNENHLDLAENNPGSGTRLVNYEVSLYGGYRRIEGYDYYDPNNSIVDEDNAEGRILSIDLFKNDITNLYEIIASRKAKSYTFATPAEGVSILSGTDDNGRALDLPFPDYTIVYRNGIKQTNGTQFTVANNEVTFTTPLTSSDEIVIDPVEYHFYKYQLSGWTKFPLDHSIRRCSLDAKLDTVKKVRSASFNFGDGNKIAFVDGANPAIVYDGEHWDVIVSTGDGTHDDQGSHAPGGPMAVDAPALVGVFENHLFIGGDATAEAVLSHSAPNDPWDWTAAGGAGQVTTGFDVIQFKPFRDNLFVFGNNGIKKVSADLTSGFIIEQVTSNVGCIARDSVLELGGDLVFLAPDGLRPVAGTSRIGDVELETISKPIQQLLTDLSKDYELGTLNGVVIRSKSQLRYFIGDDSTDVTDSYGIIGGLRSSDQRLGWEFGELIGIRASACTSAYVGRQEIVLHGDYDGKVYQQEQGSTFAGNPILAIYQTPYFDFGDTEVRKMMRKVNTFVRAEGPLVMNMAVNFDWDDPTVSKPSSYSAESKGAPVRYKGRNINYGGTNINYGGNEKPIITTSIQGSGFATQLAFVTYGDFNPYSIQGIVFEFSIAGRQ